MVNLPAKYRLTPLNEHVHKDSRSLGYLFSVHLLYHLAMCDLTRTSLPGFDFPFAATLQHTSWEFIVQCQRRCKHHAEEAAYVLKRGMRYGTSAFDDHFSSVAAFESTKILIVAFAFTHQSNDEMRSLEQSINANLEVLNFLANEDVPSPYVRQIAYIAMPRLTRSQMRTLLSLCVALGFEDIVQTPRWSDLDE